MASDIGYTVDENQTGALLFLLVYDQKLYNDHVPYKKKHNNHGCLKQPRLDLIIVTGLVLSVHFFRNWDLYIIWKLNNNFFFLG